MAAIESIKDRLARVEERIASAASRAGRSRDDIALIGVSKRFPASVIHEAYAAGLREFGENYVQEFAGKRDEVAALEGARFHLIGHLQSNKSKLAAGLFQVIQAVDSGKLARRLNDCAVDLEVMIEVKLSGEEAKSGADPSAVAELAAEIAACPHLTLTGLMTMPPWSTDAERTRPYFVRLRRLAESLGLPRLSMGMSNDFEVAIEEGATDVRVGTAIFGPRGRP